MDVAIGQTGSRGRWHLYRDATTGWAAVCGVVLSSLRIVPLREAWAEEHGTLCAKCKVAIERLMAEANRRPAKTTVQAPRTLTGRN